jgi:glutamyl-tRNA synthetase
MVTAELRAARIWDDQMVAISPESLDATLELLKPRARKLSDFCGNFRAFFTDDFAYDPAAAAKFLADPKLKELVPALLQKYSESAAFTLQSTEEDLRSLAESNGIKAGLLINALRVGLTGQGVAPGLFEVMQVLGRQRALARIQRLCDYLRLTVDE